MPVGHTHNGADGEISHVSRHTRGTKKGRAKTNGHDIASVQGFRRMLDQVYNAKHKRLLSAPIFAAVLGWKEFFTGTFQKDLGGFSSTFRHGNPPKGQEVHHIYLFKNAAGRVVFQYKALRDLNLDRPWRSGAAGIPTPQGHSGHVPRVLTDPFPNFGNFAPEPAKFLRAVLYEDDGLVRAGAFGTVLKGWIASKLGVLGPAVSGAPITDMSGMLKLVVTVVDLYAVAPTGGGGGPASRQTTCYRLGHKLLGAVYNANHPALLTNQAGRVTERD